jgi:hypothetical protein
MFVFGILRGRRQWKSLGESGKLNKTAFICMVEGCLDVEDEDA